MCDAALLQSNTTAYRWQVRGEVMIGAGSDVDRHCFDKAVQAIPIGWCRSEIAKAYLYHGYPSKALGRIGKP